MYEYRTDTMHHTNTVESSWKLFKVPSQYAHSRVSKIHEALSRRVHFPVDSSSHAERDVRCFDQRFMTMGGGRLQNHLSKLAEPIFPAAP